MRALVVDEQDPVTHEAAVSNGDPFANERMAANLAVPPDRGSLLNLDERSDAGSGADATSVEVHETVDLDVFTEHDIVGDTHEFHGESP